ncbi:MAG TPA: helix-turn-helix domain-containing protein [Telmatospirillum sp.]|nr:helix-turn-helix domain-containing protein [Telmatospirillum sp.]
MRNSQRPEDGTRGGLQTPPTQDTGNVSPGMIPFTERLTCTIADACRATGLGRTKLYELIGEGHLATTTIGRRRLVLVRSLRTLLLGHDR